MLTQIIALAGAGCFILAFELLILRDVKRGFSERPPVNREHDARE